MSCGARPWTRDLNHSNAGREAEIAKGGIGEFQKFR